MSDAEVNQLRRELIGLTARMATASHSLMVVLEAGATPFSIRHSAENLRAVLTTYAGWVRRAAGPEDRARLDELSASSAPPR